MAKGAKKKVFATRIYPQQGIKMLHEAGFEVNTPKDDKPLCNDELISRAKDCDALLCTLTDQINSEFLDSCKNLKIVSQFAVGFDNIDISQCTKLGIPVGYTPGVLTDATADIAFGLMIAVARKMHYLSNSITKGEWKYFTPNANLGQSLKNKRVGIFGFGRIGQAMARRCKGAFDMDVIYTSRNRKISAEKELDATMVGFEKLLQKSISSQSIQH